MSLSTNQSITNFNDGNKLYKASLFSEALDQYKKALDNDPTFYNAHFCLAKTLIRLKKYEDGFKHFNKFVHLIPKEKQEEYVIALSNILIDEQQQTKALLLIESLDISFNELQTFNYASILLSNNKASKAIHNILQLEKADFVAKEYKQLLNNNFFSKTTINDFSKDNIIPRFYTSLKKLSLLINMEIQNSNLKEKFNNATALVEITRSETNIDYVSKMDELEEELIQVQNIILQQGYTVLKANKISFSKRIFSVLESTKYNSKKTQEFANEIKAVEKKNTNSRVIKTSIISGIILLIGIASYFGYNTYQKSEAYNYALSSKDINTYDSFLMTFGDNEEIHKLREEKLYQIALESNNSNDIQSLINLYPDSEKLNTIRFNNINENINLAFYGVNSINTKLRGSKKLDTFIFKVPTGCKVGYRISQYDKFPIQKFFTVNQDLKISDELLESKKLLFNENFENNNSKWNIFKKQSTSKYGSSRLNEEISIQNNKLSLVNKTGNKNLVYSLIDIDNFNKNIDFKITTHVKTTKYSSNGTYLIFGASNRAFLYFGYSGTASNGSYAIGHNNWDDSSNNWKNWTSGWERVQNTGYSVTLKVEKKNNKLFFYINDILYKEYSAKKLYGSKIGFGINGGTQSSISYIKVERLNKQKQVEFKENSIYFCSVNELNVRLKGSNKGEILTTIKLAEPVKFLGKTGNKKVNATFNDIYSSDYYYKVQLKDGTIGWVHGGALCEINATDLNDKMTLNPVIKKTNDSLQTSNKIDNYKYDYFIIDKETNIETNSFKNIDAYIKNTKDSITVSEIININEIINLETLKIGDTIYLTGESFLNNKKAIISLNNKNEDTVPFDFAEETPTFGKCREKSNASIKKCFSTNLNNYIKLKADTKQYKNLGLTDGLKSIKYSFIILKNGIPSNIKVWAEHAFIEDDITSIIENIKDFEPGKLEENEIDVSYNSIVNIRIGEIPVIIKPKQANTKPEPIIDEVIIPSNLTFHSVDRAPIFPGCETNPDASMFACSTKKINIFIQENINYDKLAVVEDKTYTAKVSTSFNINTSGKTTKININCSTKADNTIKELIIEEIKRVINSIPTMQPAIYSGTQVEVNYKTTINIKF